MSPLAPGDWVERISTGLTMKRGSIWQVKEVGYHVAASYCDACMPKRTPWIAVFNEPPHPDPRPFCACQFRPIYTPKQSLLESLRTVSRDQVLA